ncbi:MAG: shikimate dehydrogenase [Clostridiaceae bacterium]
MSNFYGLIGEKLGHSISPEIHGEIFKKLNTGATYSLFEIKKDELPEAIKGLKALGCRGTNVTIPYKTEIMKCLDKISAEAEKIGAVNTVAFTEAGLTGYNTDYYGFGLTLKRTSIGISGKKAVVLGTGGAAKAVLEYLNDHHVGEITFVSRDPVKADGKVKSQSIISYSELRNIGSKDIIINCTPMGMYPGMDVSPVEKGILSSFKTAVDLIYNPIETKFLKYAREEGLVTANGLYMVTAQAAAAQEIWQGVKFSDEFIAELYNSVKEAIES